MLHKKESALAAYYKVLVIFFKALHGGATRYITDRLRSYQPAQSLRSSSMNMLVLVLTFVMESKPSLSLDRTCGTTFKVTCEVSPPFKTLKLT